MHTRTFHKRTNKNVKVHFIYWVFCKSTGTQKMCISVPDIPSIHTDIRWAYQQKYMYRIQWLVGKLKTKLHHNVGKFV